MKKLFLLLIITTLSLVGSAQDDDFYGPTQEQSKDLKKEQRQKKFENWSFGGNLWFGFGSGFFIDVSPVALYNFSPRLQAGGGIMYYYERFNNQYYNDNYELKTQHINMTIFGPKAVIQFTLFQNLNEKINIGIHNIVLYGEYSHLYTDKFSQNANTYKIAYDGSDWYGNLLLGGGIYQPFQNRGGFSLIILYNFLENDYSPYTNPIVRFGFYF